MQPEKMDTTRKEAPLHPSEPGTPPIRLTRAPPVGTVVYAPERSMELSRRIILYFPATCSGRVLDILKDTPYWGGDRQSGADEKTFR